MLFKQLRKHTLLFALLCSISCLYNTPIIAMSTLNENLIDAIRSDDIDSIRKSIAAGADVNAMNNGMRPLVSAAYTKNIDIIRLLLEAGADVNATNRSKQSPLYAAIVKNHTDIARELIKNGANSKALDIAWAAYNGNIDIIKTLIRSGADITIKNKAGKTALDIALENKHAVPADRQARFDAAIQLLADINTIKNARNTVSKWGIFTFVDKTAPEKLKSFLKQEEFIHGLSKEQQEQLAEKGTMAQIPEELLSIFNEAVRLKEEYPVQWKQYITDRR